MQIVQAVIFDGDRVLLAVRSDLCGWEIPGGTVEAGECEDDALRREICEETGLDIAVDGEVGRYTRSGFRPHTAIVFYCHAMGGNLRLSHESLALRWFSAAHLPDTLFSWCRVPLADALAGRTGVERYEHQGWTEILAAMKIDWRMRFSEEDWECESVTVPSSPKTKRPAE